MLLHRQALIVFLPNKPIAQSLGMLAKLNTRDDEPYFALVNVYQRR